MTVPEREQSGKTGRIQDVNTEKTAGNTGVYRKQSQTLPLMTRILLISSDKKLTTARQRKSQPRINANESESTRISEEQNRNFWNKKNEIVV